MMSNAASQKVEEGYRGEEKEKVEVGRGFHIDRFSSWVKAACKYVKSKQPPHATLSKHLDPHLSPLLPDTSISSTLYHLNRM
jgi:hypothetical protein